MPLVLRLHSFLSDLGITFDLFVVNSISFQYSRDVLNRLALNQRLLLLDSYYCEGSFLSHLLINILSESSSNLNAFKHVGLPFEHESTSYFLTRDRYFSFRSLVDLVSKFIDKPFINNSVVASFEHHDVPGSWFTGPF